MIYTQIFIPIGITNLMLSVAALYGERDGELSSFSSIDKSDP